MTNEQINIAIAEACGWTSIHELNDIYPDGQVVVGVWRQGVPPRESELQGEQLIPDYSNDLNAMHEAEKMLSDDQTFLYREEIYILIDDPDVVMYGWYSTHATARQRAEAFLRTIGKWEEEK